jgi:hypothetical protein
MRKPEYQGYTFPSSSTAKPWYCMTWNRSSHRNQPACHPSPPPQARQAACCTGQQELTPLYCGFDRSDDRNPRAQSRFKRWTEGPHGQKRGKLHSKSTLGVMAKKWNRGHSKAWSRSLGTTLPRSGVPEARSRGMVILTGFQTVFDGVKKYRLPFSECTM